MDLDPGILLLLLWGLLSIFGGIAKKKQQRSQRPGQSPVPPPRSRREPATFEDLLADMREQLEAAQRAERAEQEEGAGGREPLPWEEEVEEVESLEVEPVVVSMEGPARIEERAIVDSDLEGQRLIAERLREAEARNRAWRLDDHRQFDARIRAPAAEAAPPPRHVRDLRRAVIWREILGKPVSLRGS